MSDEHVAKRLARSVLSVRARRRQIGIPNRFSKVPTWSKDEDKQLGTLPGPGNCEGAQNVTFRRYATGVGFWESHPRGQREICGRGIPTPNRARAWTTSEEDLLGTYPDKELAIQLKRSQRNRARGQKFRRNPFPAACATKIGIAIAGALLKVAQTQYIRSWYGGRLRPKA